ncbi:MAG: DUF86 domain-containing protein [Ignavibacteriales bacterium]|nr:DUF86 domain-containing protein [Ignavibacteriales bacterium]
MSRDESLYLADIQESCEKVLRFTKGMTYKDFVHDDLHFDAVLRNLEIIGEAVKNISEETRNKYPKIKWRKIAGFRDIVAHEYFGINDETVWDIVENEIPALLEIVKVMLGEK